MRCADSLPPEAVLRLAELSNALSKFVPASPPFAALQHETFRTLDKYLDKGVGACPLKRFDVAAAVCAEFVRLAGWNVDVPHFTLMPNHWHALIVLSGIMKRIKGRTARHIRTLIGERGPVWQSEWFDRWMRSDAEWEKCVAYIRNNPVKAGLARTWHEHAWTK